MKRRHIASASGIIQRAMTLPLEKNIFKVARLYSKPSSLRPRDTSSLNPGRVMSWNTAPNSERLWTHPVSIKKTPTPPMQLKQQCWCD